MDYTTSANIPSPTVGPTLYHFEDYNQRIVIAFVLCVVFLIGTIGNTLVILAVVLSRKLRSSTNWFVVNLACADLLTCLSLPFAIVAMLSRDGWPLPGWVCAANSAIILTCLGSSVTTLALIAYNRWYLLTQPKINFQKLYTTRKFCLMISFAWIYPLLLILIPHFAGLGKLGYSKEYKSCTQDTSTQYSEYYSLLAGVGLIVPVSIAIVVIYIRLYLHISRHSKAMSSRQQKTSSSHPPEHGSISTELNSTQNISQQTGTSSVSLSGVNDGSRPNTDASTTHGDESIACSEGTCRTTRERDPQSEIIPRAAQQSIDTVSMKVDRQTKTDVHAPSGKTTKSENQGKAVNKAPSQVNKYHVKVTKRLAVVVLVFFMCLLPFGVSVMVPPSDPGIPWTGLLVTINSCLNPLIYARTMPVFRQVMGNIIRCRFRNIPEPVSCLRRTNLN